MAGFSARRTLHAQEPAHRGADRRDRPGVRSPGRDGRRGRQEAWDHRHNAVPLAQEVRRPGAEPGGGAGAVAAREHAAEEGGGPARAGQRGAQGDQRKKMVSARARREQVDYAVGRGVSVRRSCALLQVSRSALGYESRLVARDAELGVALQRIAARHPRYGHRFAWALLRRDGLAVNRKRVRRVWRSLGLQATRKKRRKIRTGQPRVLTPTGPNQVWAYDFVH